MTKNSFFTCSECEMPRPLFVVGSVPQHTEAELQLIGQALEKTTRLREFNFCIDSLITDMYVDSSEVVLKKNYSTMAPLFLGYFKKNTSIEAFTLFGETEQAKSKWQYYLNQFAASLSITGLSNNSLPWIFCLIELIVLY